VTAFLCLIAAAFGIITSAPAYCLVLPAMLMGAYYLYGLYRIQQNPPVSASGGRNTDINPSGVGSNPPLNQIKPPEDAFGGLARKAACWAAGCRRAMRRRRIEHSVFVRKDAWPVIIQGGILSVFLLYMLLRKETAFFYRALSDLSLAFSGLAGAFIQRPISMSVTYSGVDIVCLFLIAFAVTGLICREKSALKYLAGLGGVFAVWGIYMALWTVLAENSITLGLNRLEPVTGPLDYRALLFAALLAVYTPVYGKLRAKIAKAPAPGRRAKIAAAALTALCLALYLLSFMNPKAPALIAGKQVIFWDSGIDFTVPADGKYGLDQVGMFGFLPDYLEAKGYVCGVADRIDAQVLETADVLVVINPMTTPDQESLDAIWRFVRRGGGLLAAGDHTGDRQIRLPLNAMLEPAGMSFNFDSAIPFQNLWPDAFVMRRSPVFSNVSRCQIQAVVGASLEFAYGARPLLIGKTGYSDAGDLNNEADGFLGDMRFSRGERVGDLVLAAEAGYGAGKMLAFGDTSFLQNTTLAYSYPLIDNLFAYLANDGAEAVYGPSSSRDYAASCLIDAGHMPSFKTDKSGDAADGFIASVLRAGMIPYVGRRTELARSIEETQDLKLVALVEPALSLSAEDLLSLQNFVADGGTAMLFGTYRSPEATRALFAHFGFAFENLPVGRISPARNPEMAFWNACPLLYDGRPTAQTPETENLMDIWGYGVIARLNLGRGRVYAFGDGDFIKNKNLESIDAYRKGNIDFIGGLLRDIAGNKTYPEGGPGA
jgi:hypothetical protein